MSVLIFLLTVIANFFLYWCYDIYRKNKLLEKIPGPPPIPFFGMKLPSDIYGFHKMLDKLHAKYGKTFKMYIGGTMQVLTSDVHLIATLTSKPNPNIIKSNSYELLEPWLMDGLILSEGELWKNRRKLCTKSFHVSLMPDFFKTFNAAASTLTRKLGEAADKNAVIDVIQYTSKMSFDIVAETSFGVKLNSQDGNHVEYINAIAEYTAIVMEKIFSVWKRVRLLFKIFNSKRYSVQEESLIILNKTAMNIIQERREINSKAPEKVSKSKHNSILIDNLMQHPGIDDSYILAEGNNFLFAGQDTTSASLSFISYELSKQPDIQEKLYEEISSYVNGDINNLTQEIVSEMKYLDMVVREALRIRTPIPFIQKQVIKDTLIGDTMYPKGTTISILLYWLHRDSEVYPDPEKFDPERFSPENQNNRSSFAFLPFSAGGRNCIGQKYALLEIKTALSRIIYEFTIHPTKNFKLELGLGAILRSKHGFPVKLHRRQ